jgi:hypothetical protein
MLKEEFKGLGVHRLKDNPLERVFAEKWQEQCEKATLEYIISGFANRRDPVSKEVQVTSNTVIQWLGSPVGQGFLVEVLRTKEAEYFLSYMLGDKELRERIQKLLKKLL